MNLEAWLALLEQRHPKSIDLGLERCGEVYRRMGSPRPARRVYTVAGTNGKGSTVAYLAAISGALGQSYGTYTSPHIVSFNERIRIGTEAVPDDVLERAFERVEAARGTTSLTYFEFTTLAALLILNEADLDCAVLEVGLGGRLDTVNLVDADCVVITPIGLDHQDYLGPDIASIAREKAGVIRPQIPVVCTQNKPPAALLQIARQQHCDVYIRGTDFDISKSAAPGTATLEFSIRGRSIAVAGPPMAGGHQVDNLAAALAAILVMNPGCAAQAGAMSSAISSCVVAGRLQQVGSSPAILVDVGHNELAAQVIAEYLQNNPFRGVTAVLAMLADKSAEAVAQSLGDVCQNWYCAASPGERGQSGDRLAARIRSVLPDARVLSFDTVGHSLQAALNDATADATILVFGSFTTVSAAFEWLRNPVKQEGHDAAKLPS
jgi:dihydrofolate synthase/folylpolyglutamate synthase